MSKKQHQHFIPKSYLKNFALKKDNAFLVEAKLKSDKKPKNELISITDICVNKNLYTLPNRNGDEKYALEDFYAREIDEVYPEVYNWLIDPKKTTITSDERGKIIMTTMSLFFRTPKFLNYNQRTLNSVLEYAKKNFQNKNGDIKFKFKDIELDFNIKDIDEVTQNLKLQNKVEFLQGHLKDWHEFRMFKLFSAISVYKIYDNIDLITSDNPVIMHSIKGNTFNLFDPSNMISLPLDNKHYISIFPNTEAAMLDTIYRADRDLWFALTTNLQVEKNCEDWILGKPCSITAHFIDQIKYNEETAENWKSVENMRERAEDGLELAKLMEKGNFPNQEIADLVNNMMIKDFHKQDPEIVKIAKILINHGFRINLL